MTDTETAITPAPATPMAILAAVASNPECDVEKMTAIVELQERMMASEAKAAWADAMAGFQADCPIIPKRARGDKAKFAPLEDIMAVVSPLLREHGLSVSFSSEPAGAGALHITCHITRGTHTETRDFTCPVPSMINPKTNLPMANEAQCMGMALSYAKRYCLCAALNIVTAGEDFDGGPPPPNPAPDADPDAPQAATRAERSEAQQTADRLWARWLAAGGDAKGWKSMLKQASGLTTITGPDQLDFAAWEKAEILVEEKEEVGNA